MERCLQIIYKAAFLAAGILLAWVLIAENSALGAFLCGLGFTAVLVWAALKWEIPRFGLWLFLLIFASRLAFVLCIQTPVQSDFAALLEAATQWSSGEFSFLEDSYFQLYPYQLPFVALEALLLCLSGGSVFFLKIVNCLFVAGSGFFLYAFAQILFSRRAAQAAGAAFLCTFSYACLVTVLTNQHAAAFFALLGFYLLVSPRLEKLGLGRYALTGASLGVSALLRPEGAILLTGLGAFALFSLLRRRRACWPWGVLAAALTLGCYFLTTALAGWCFDAAGFTANGLSSPNPLWKFVLGLNASSGGAYSYEDAAALNALMAQYGGVTDAVLSWEKELIASRLQAGPGALFSLALEKLGSQWTDIAYYWSTGHMNGDAALGPITLNTALRWLSGGEQGLRLGLLALSALGLMPFRQCIEPKKLLPGFVFFAAFCAFLLVEVQGRYSYLPLLFLYAAAAGGVDTLAAWRRKRHDTLS